jgi:amino acid adenylation domain-containing protein
MSTDANHMSLVKRTLLALEEMQARLDAAERARTEPIAIVGMACRFPGGATDPDAFWRLLEAGGDAIVEVPKERWDADAFFHPEAATPGKMSTRWGGFLHQVDGFDAGFFGISPREALRMDPQQRLLLEVAWEALEDAGQTRDRLAGSRTGVFAGICSTDYSWLQFADLEGIDAYTGTGTSLSILAGRLAYLLDLRGPSLAVDTACSSSLVAVHLACQSLRARESDAALAGGVNLILSPHTTIVASQMRMMAADGRCKTFDARADGFVRGEGCGVVVLKRLSDALRDGDPIHAVIRGSAVNGDGRTVGLTAPNGQAQEAVVRRALESAGVKARDIGYVEAHGTGTALGDPIEMEALAAAFGDPGAAAGSCPVGSVKTNVGHLEAAAGIAGLIKVALVLRNEAIPPVLHFESLNPHISLAGTPFAIPTDLLPWRRNGRPRIAGTSSFGWSGTNAHVVVEEAPAATAVPEPAGDDTPRVLTLSAHAPEALRTLAKAYRARLSEPGAPALRDLCFTASLRRTHHDQRLAVLGRTHAEFADRLNAFLEGEARPGLAVGARGGSRKLVFVFPGQGGQWPGMARDLLDDPVFAAELARVETALRPHVDWSLAEVLGADLADARIDRIDRIDVLQPALFAVQLALAAMWRSYGVIPDAVVGHSMGEVAAACVAGILSVEDGARVMSRRSQLLRRASGKGGMALVELPLAEAERAIRGHEHAVSIAASNGPTTTVLSGDPAVLAEILRLLEAREVFCRLVKVDVASHSPQVDRLRPALEAALAGLVPSAAAIPFHSTVTGAPARGPELDARYWVENLRRPVLFAPAVERLVAGGHDLFVEIAPHPTLALGVNEVLRRAEKGGAVLPSLRRDEPSRQVLLGSLGGLWAHGHPVEWKRQFPDGGRVVPLPAYPWQRERFWHAPTAARAHAPADPPGHPLLGRRLAVAHAPGHHLWQTNVDLARVPYIDDHRVQGLAVLPGTGYVEMALAAATDALGHGPHVFSSFEFKRLLFFPEDGARTVQTSFTTGEGGAARIQVHSRPAGEDAAWTLHAAAAAAPMRGITRPAPAELAEIAARCPEEVDAEGFYREFARRGNHWGPRFQGIRRIRRGAREALAELVPPAALEPELDRYQIHPALLDACLQVLGATVPVAATGSAQSFVPVHVERIAVHGRPNGSALLHGHARLRPGAVQTAASFEGDVQLLDERGAVLVDFQGLRGRGLDRDAVAGGERISEWLYELRFTPRERLARAAAAERPGRWLVLADDGGVAEALAASLQERGEDVCLERPAADGDIARVICAHAARDDGRPFRGVIHLAAIGTGETLDPASLGEAERRGCGTAIAALRALAGAGVRPSPRLWLVTRGAQAVAPGEAPAAVGQATLWGLGRTIPLETAPLWGGLVDLDPTASAAEAAAFLRDEMLHPDGEDQVALRGGQRYAARLARASTAPERATALVPDGAYVLTGGLGGLGLVVAGWMVERGARQLVLLGRTKLPDRSAWETIPVDSPLGATIAAIRALEARGATVHTPAADVSDEPRLRAVLRELRAAGLPPVRGAVHAAGVAELRPLEELDGASLGATLRPKVLGAATLARVLEDEPLDLFVLFSSMSSVLSSPLLGAYAAANAFLDALAHRRRAQGLPALSIGWGFWEEVGMGVRFGKQAGRSGPAQGMGSFSPAQGLAALERLLAGAPAHVGVMPVDWRRWEEHHPSAARLPVLADVMGGVAAPGVGERRTKGLDPEALLAAPEAERAALVEGYLRRRVARVLRLAEARVDPEKPLHRLGLDSLMAVELKNGIEADLGVTVPMVRFLQGPSVSQLAVQLLGLVAERGQPGAAAPPVSAPALPTLTPNAAGRGEPFPLNDIQQAYWIGRTGFLELGNVAAHMYLELEARDLDLPRLEAAWRQLVARHDMLRAIVLPDGRQQVQAGLPPYVIQVEDLLGDPPEVVEARLGATRECLSHQVMPTDVWPLFEIRASRLDVQRVRLHLSFDILIADVWSWRILFREWAELYRDPGAVLKPLALTFRDYVLAERALEGSDALARSLAYWQRRIPTLPPAPDLPLATAPGALGAPRFARRTSRLDPDAWSRLRARAAEAGLTPSGVLLAAFGEVLATWSKIPRFTINVTLFNRLPLHPQVKDIVGDFTSVNLLAVDVAAPGDFEARARRLQTQLWEDLEHGGVSGVRVMRELARVHGGAPRATMPIVFTSTLLSSQPGEEEAFPLEWLGEMAYSISQTPQVWLDHQVFEHKGALVFNWDHVEALFPPSVIDDMFAAYCALLGRLAGDDAAWHAENRDVVPATQLAARAEVNATDATVPAGLLHDPFLARAAEQPDAPAVIAADRTLTYGELLRRSTALAHELRARGARRDRLVAVVMEKGWEQVVAVLAVLQSGAAYLPISPAVPRERLWYLLEHGEVDLVLTQPAVDARLEWPAQVARIAIRPELPEERSPLPPAQDPGDLAYVIFTSGSTGRPKGVMIEHRAALNTIRDMNARFRVGASDRVLALSSLSFDLSVYDVFGILAAGGAMVIPDPASARDPARWAELLVRHRVTIWDSVPALMQALVDHAEGDPGRLRAPLRVVLLSGDWIPVALPDQIRDLVPGAEVHSLGGATEAAIWSIHYPIREVPPGWKSIPYGKPMVNQHFHVLNELLEPCPVGVPGQLHIGGVGVARGYWRDEEKTAKSFFVRPRTGERLYCTGDLGRWLPDGNIEFLGREDFQVKVNGFRIELGEIEAALEGHPDVAAAVAAAVGPQRGPRRLVGYVVPRAGSSPLPADLRRFLLEKLPDYMVPQTFVALPSLPLSSNGKVDRSALPPPAAATPAIVSRPAALDPTAGRIAALIARVLRVESVAPTANLLDLGASSLEMIRIAGLLLQELGARPPLETFYEDPTVAGLAAWYARRPAAG